MRSSSPSRGWLIKPADPSATSPRTRLRRRRVIHEKHLRPKMCTNYKLDPACHMTKVSRNTSFTWKVGHPKNCFWTSSIQRWISTVRNSCVLRGCPTVKNECPTVEHIDKPQSDQCCNNCLLFWHVSAHICSVTVQNQVAHFISRNTKIHTQKLTWIPNTMV